MSSLRGAGATEVIAEDGGLVLIIPIALRRRHGRQHVVTSERGTGTDSGGVATPLQRALARAHRWQQMLDAGEIASISELARREGEDFSYIARMLNLTLLAPDIVAAILDDILPASVRLHDLAINPLPLWEQQRIEVMSEHVD